MVPCGLVDIFFYKEIVNLMITTRLVECYFINKSAYILVLDVATSFLTLFINSLLFAFCRTYFIFFIVYKILCGMLQKPKKLVYLRPFNDTLIAWLKPMTCPFNDMLFT